MATARNTDTTTGISGVITVSNLPVILTIAAIIIGLAALLPLVQSSGATSIAGRIQQLEQQKADSQAQLRESELAVARLGSLDRVEAEARTRLHMELPKDIRYINVDAPAPEEQKLPSRFLPLQPAHVTTGSSFWSDLFGWLPFP
jgi:cell division protein FtsL